MNGILVRDDEPKIECEDGKLLKFVVNIKVEEFIGNIKINFNQHIGAEQRVQETSLQTWDKREGILVWSCTLLSMVFMVSKISLEMASRSMVKTNVLQSEK